MAVSKIDEARERKEFNEETKTTLMDFKAKINELKAKRKGVNEEVSAEMNRLEGKGFSKKGLKAALTFMELDETDAKLFDNTFIAMRVACGHPVQPDLFQATLNANFLKNDESEEEQQELAES